jgi:hypothetical protein
LVTEVTEELETSKHKKRRRLPFLFVYINFFFIIKVKMEEDIVPMTLKLKKTKQVVTYNKERRPSNTKCVMNYYYENPKDFLPVTQGGLNLAPGPRPWPNFVKRSETSAGTVIKKLSGTDAFQDPALYRPVMMAEYINKYFVQPYEDIGRQSPFMYPDPLSVIENQDRSKYQLNPQQKFLPKFISLDTDFLGLMGMHGIGAGKTAAAVATAEEFKTKYRKGDQFVNIPDRKVTVKNNISRDCAVTFVVPKNLLNDYVDEIVGRVRNGSIMSATGQCVIYCEDDSDSLEEHGPETYRQIYQGRLVKNEAGKWIYENKSLNELHKLESDLAAIGQKIAVLQNDLKELTLQAASEDKKKKLIAEIGRQNEKMTKLKKEITTKYVSINRDVNDIYFIVAQETFTSRLRKDLNKETDETKKMYTASDFVLGTNPKFVNDPTGSFRGNPAGLHPDCLHSMKTLIIIDEIQKLVSEDRVNYNTLYNTLNMYSRSFVDGSPVVKVIELTGNPVHNNPHQAANSLNLLRLRIPFPRKEKIYNEMFIDYERNKMRNKLLHSYMCSGYVSYFKGGSPVEYPYRRNHIKLHKMHSVQYDQYKEQLMHDIAKIKQNKSRGDHDKYDALFEKSVANIYRGSAAVSMCAMPGNPKYIDRTDEKFLNMNDENLKTVIRSGKFHEYSSKLADLGDHILKHAATGRGPLFVYSSHVQRGLRPLSIYLEHLGFKFLGHNGNQNAKPAVLSAQKQMRYGVWSDSLFNDYYKNFVGSDDQTTYRDKMKKLINSPENIDGSVCQVILANITEGVSFMNISEVHLCDVWWNEPRMEQIIGRGIRFRSHSDLPEDRRFVDVFYHCSVLPSYPEVDPDLVNKVGYRKKCDVCKKKKADKALLIGDKNAKNIEGTRTKEEVRRVQLEDAEGRTVEVEVKKGGFKKTANIYENIVDDGTEKCFCDELVNQGPMGFDFTRNTIEQRIMSTAQKKNSLNKEFEQCLKESAVDALLNKNGNIVRFEESTFPEMLNIDSGKKLPKKARIMYDRTANNYYLYDLSDGSMYSTTLTSTTNAWPPNRCKIESAVELDLIKPAEVLLDDRNREMIFIMLVEKINAFIYDNRFNKLNFYELRDLAISEYGEDQKAWDYAERQYKCSQLMKILFRENHGNYTTADLTT